MSEQVATGTGSISRKQVAWDAKSVGKCASHSAEKVYTIAIFVHECSSKKAHSGSFFNYVERCKARSYHIHVLRYRVVSMARQF